MAWTYDPRAHRYRDSETGQFMSRNTAMGLVTSSIHSTSNVTDELARLVAEGMLSPADWHERMREEIKREVIRQYVLGRGGIQNMTQEDWGSVGGIVSDQYRHLDRKADNFLDQVESGDLAEGTIAHRSRMYINSAREAFERGQRRRLENTDYDEEGWFTTSGESCNDCIDLEAMGWVEIGTLPTVPGAGDTVCLTACQCFIRYRISESGAVFGESETDDPSLERWKVRAWA